ncbi:MAG: metallo-beta-lactamase, ribonuclease J [candidate division Kazan bacterium GW2011_GWA1_50_15]|uniref:Ribonuclease J n=2 Tax=Bacteria division Kazan-3B-28 TaxID=1798534 RepID=A0A0G1X8R5_UNCK3|nr:MAG: metallo-beta-lactamase, ribonuclease J [candidate division Kazan bacterium GW2011_GWA1_50_15]KKW25790.1 MAG: Metallo-beta-lactamase family protein [candidate division Kazan bacterium GW2011_GWC1_52_13]KKW27195.1 MAG: Metallo-beta-lactamase family protein [candidate division Kazan bacterium GW2011_GWB1_52_7]
MGKNMIVVEYGDDIVILDCGMMMPDESMLGIDYVIPDPTYLERNQKKLRGIIVTHGHEDHIGAIQHLVPRLGVPVYAPRLAAELIKVNLEEFSDAQNVRVNTYQAGDRIRLGVFTVSFVRVNHSIPDTFSIVVDTPEGKVIYTGDFKFDPTPPDGIKADYAKFEQLGREGVLLLMSESTNVHTPGRTPSEQVIADAFMEIFAKTSGRLIVASFASRIDRMQHVIAAAVKYRRKVAIAGRSMLKYFDVASKAGYIKTPKGLIVDLRSIKKYKDSQLVILSTGSQGQEGSALQRMAFGEHKQVKIHSGDTVVISSSAIPGNERSINSVINNLYRQGANVIFDKKMQIHVTGHAYREEMKQMLTMVKPRWFIPVHGEYHMLVSHKELAEETGIKPANIIIMEDGDVIEFRQGQGRKSNQKVPVGGIMVDGLGVGDVKEVVLRDRQAMAKEGMIVLIALVDKKGKIIGSPDIISRGFVYMREKGDLINKTRQKVKDIFAQHVQSVPDDWTNIKTKLREHIGEFIFREIERRPLVLPVIIEV